MTDSLSIIILAAGKGTRMKSDLPKVMHKVANREMLNLVIDEAKTLNPQNITIVISSEMTKFKPQTLKTHSEVTINFVEQKKRLGTGHAVSTALKNISNLGQKLLILYGDTPLVSQNSLKQMIEKITNSSLCILGFDDFSKNSYGRLVVDNQGNLEKIVEFKDATKEEKSISLCNSGVIAVDGTKISDLLSKIDDNNASKEFYLTDIVAIAKNSNLNCSFIKTNIDEVLGANSRSDLAQLEQIKQQQLRQKMMALGVTLIDPKTVYFSYDTDIANDVIIEPNVYFGSQVKIGKDVTIKSFSHIEGATINNNSTIGPFARIRPNTNIASDVKIGNFVEVKKSQINEGAKISHLSYIGDSEIGQETNIGAGTITCNYDGYNKFKTKIGKNVFIGSNSALVAPIDIADGAVIGAGSTITKNVEADDLAVSRAKQINLTKGGANFHKNKAKNDQN